MNKQHEQIAEVGQIWQRGSTGEEFTILDTKFYISRGETLYVGVYADRKAKRQWASYYESKLNREFIYTDKCIDKETVKKFKLSQNAHSEQFDNDVQEIVTAQDEIQVYEQELSDFTEEVSEFSTKYLEDRRTKYLEDRRTKYLEDRRTKYLEDMAYTLNKHNETVKLDIVLDVLHKRAVKGGDSKKDDGPLAKVFNVLDYTHLFKSNSGLWKWTQ